MSLNRKPSNQTEIRRHGRSNCFFPKRSMKMWKSWVFRIIHVPSIEENVEFFNNMSLYTEYFNFFNNSAKVGVSTMKNLRFSINISTKQIYQHFDTWCHLYMCKKKLIGVFNLKPTNQPQVKSVNINNIWWKPWLIIMYSVNERRFHVIWWTYKRARRGVVVLHVPHSRHWYLVINKGNHACTSMRS